MSDPVNDLGTLHASLGAAESNIAAMTSASPKTLDVVPVPSHDFRHHTELSLTPSKPGCYIHYYERGPVRDP